MPVCSAGPYIYGLALDGEDGVRQVIENIVAELDVTMGLLGVRTVQDLSNHHLTPYRGDHRRGSAGV